MAPALGTTKVTRDRMEMTMGIEVIQERSRRQEAGLLMMLRMVVTMKRMMSSNELTAPPISSPVPTTPKAYQTFTEIRCFNINRHKYQHNIYVQLY